jgi:hypothetical protein
MSDKINITILEDGTITIETDSISPSNHVSADQFLEMVERLAGNKTSEKAKAKGLTHKHGNLIHAH